MELSSTDKKKYRKLWLKYIDLFMEGDPNNWFRRHQPHIFFKHLFRQVVKDRLGLTQAELQHFETAITRTEVHHTTLMNSLNNRTENWSLHRVLIEQAKEFINIHFTPPGQSKVKDFIQQQQAKGKSLSDIANELYVTRECLVDVLQEMNLPEELITYLDTRIQNVY